MNEDEKALRRSHDLSHQLAVRLYQTQINFGDEQDTPLLAMLYAAEMNASLWRRILRDCGTPKDLTKLVQKLASACGGEIYEVVRPVLESRIRQARSLVDEKLAEALAKSALEEITQQHRKDTKKG